VEYRSAIDFTIAPSRLFGPSSFPSYASVHLHFFLCSLTPIVISILRLHPYSFHSLLPYAHHHFHPTTPSIFISFSAPFGPSSFPSYASVHLHSIVFSIPSIVISILRLCPSSFHFIFHSADHHLQHTPLSIFI